MRIYVIHLKSKEFINFDDMKRGFYLNKTLVVSVIIAIITTMACNSKGHTDNIKHDIDTVGMLVSQIKSCSRLFTAE